MGFRQILIDRLVQHYGRFVRPSLEALPLGTLVSDEYDLTFEGRIGEHPQYTKRMFFDDPGFTVWNDEDGVEWEFVKGGFFSLFSYWDWVERKIAVSGEAPFREPLPYSDPIGGRSGDEPMRPVLTLSGKEIERILDLIARDQPPNDEAEQHFLNVLAGNAEPRTLKEEEWVEYHRRWDANQRAEALGYCSDTPEAKLKYRSLHAWEKTFEGSHGSFQAIDYLTKLDP